uniref:JmjC domain-containing protein n=1 Tax=Branchiostoma floridae TaxID=7739 RepID=C3ZDE8_BRAFL|eukprot:XP_002593492.1 hypothetical protein BRAFLDRAFT_119506 [Branchiostoma floridae]
MDPVWKFVVLLAVCGSVTGDSAIPMGHLQPLGGHRPPDVPIDELHTIPHPREFWDKYVKHEKAVILRGAAKNSPSFTLWTDEYLKDKYGKLEAWEPSREIGGYSEVNVHQVDLLQHPNMAKVRWSNFTIHAGDCLYLPKSYWHQVESVGDVNLAVALLFARLEEFDDSDCDTQKVEYTPLSDFQVSFYEV